MNLTDLFGVVLAPLTAMLTLVMGYYFASRANEEVAKQTKADIAQAESKVEQQPERAKLAWDLARITLEAYFARNLSQINLIFWLSVSVMVAGFGILTWGIFQAISAQQSSLPSTLSVGAGLITEFIGATFLFVYKSTIQQAITYSQTLERINSVGMAMQILDTMPETVPATDLRSKTKAALVELLVRQAHGQLESAEKAPTRAAGGRRKSNPSLGP